MAEQNGNARDDAGMEDDHGDAPSRRRVIGLGAAIGAGAWVAPAILSLDAAAAQSQPPPPPGAGTLQGELLECGHEVDPGDQFQITADRQGGGGTGSVLTTPGSSFYSITNLPGGTYDVTIHPVNFQGADQLDTNVAVAAAGISIHSITYEANGC